MENAEKTSVGARVRNRRADQRETLRVQGSIPRGDPEVTELLLFADQPGTCRKCQVMLDAGLLHLSCYERCRSRYALARIRSPQRFGAHQRLSPGRESSQKTALHFEFSHRRIRASCFGSPKSTTASCAMVASTAFTVGRCHRFDFAAASSCFTKPGSRAIAFIRRTSPVPGIVRSRTAFAIRHIAPRRALARCKSSSLIRTFGSLTGQSDNQRCSSPGLVSRSNRLP